MIASNVSETFAASRSVTWISLGVALVSLGLLIALHKRVAVRAVCPYTLALGLLWALTAAILGDGLLD